MSDAMFIKEEIDINDLDDILWGGAKTRWDNATEDQKEEVFDLVFDYVTKRGRVVPTKTEVNDFIWYNCDHVFYDDLDESYNRRRQMRRKEARRKSILSHI